jgi:hypothetical protein
VGKLVPRELEIVVVGLQHRLTPSTRKLLADRVEKEIIEAYIEREPDNVHDDNAIKVVISKGAYKNMHIGYIPRGVAAIMAPAIDEGAIEISSAEGSIVDVDPFDGTATMLLEFKAAVNVKGAKRKGAKRKTA